MFLLAAVLWFAEPAPLDMPRAEAYLVKESDGRRYLEDRYDELDLWTSREVLGRWKDRDGRRLVVSKLDAVPPMFLGDTMTRAAFEKDVARLDPKKDEDPLRLAVSRLSPVELPDEFASPRQRTRGMKEVRHYNGTNTSAVVCAFLPEKSSAWYLASWELVDGDDFEYAKETFEKEFLEDFADRVKEGLRSESALLERDGPTKETRKSRHAAIPGERELLRAAALHSVTNYSGWHFTSAPEFAIIDCLPDGNSFVATLTNELTKMRAKYAATVPTPLDVSNVLAVARIFKDRDGYLASLGDNGIEGLEWSAAYWSQSRRELVAYLPEDGSRELLKTFRHEAFHQYLSYACSMAAASPWLNEGYAQYFEDAESADWKMEIDLDQIAELLPAVLAMDYEEFYSGSSALRQLKYRMAWSVAYFLENGAPKVRFQPFKDVKKQYVESLLRHRDMRLATAEAFGTKDNLDKFVSEWKKFWSKL